MGTPVTAAHGDGRAAASVAVDLGEDQAGQADLLVEAFGDADGFLAGHRVGHEQHFDRLGAVADGDKLIHERVVNLQTAGGVEDDHGFALLFAGGHGLGGDLTAAGRRR